MVRAILLLLFILQFQHIGWAQELDPKGIFINDSVRIGELTPYSFSMRYPNEMEVLFPDSAFNFSPFECASVNYFPTRLVGNIRIDSAIYYLQLFQIDDKQLFQLPAFIINGADCTLVFSTTDSIAFKHTITQPVDTLQLVLDVALRPVDKEFNRPLAYLIGGIFLLLMLILFLVFGKNIRKKIQLYRLRKVHQRFCSAFEQGIINTNNNQQQLELQVFIWKRYLEKLESNPYTKLTTKEIQLLTKDDSLIELLRWCDLAIYGGKPLAENTLNLLLQKAEERYQEKVKEITHE